MLARSGWVVVGAKSRSTGEFLAPLFFRCRSIENHRKPRNPVPGHMQGLGNRDAQLIFNCMFGNDHTWQRFGACRCKAVQSSLFWVHQFCTSIYGTPVRRRGHPWPRYSCAMRITSKPKRCAKVPDDALLAEGETLIFEAPLARCKIPCRASQYTGPGEVGLQLRLAPLSSH